MKEVVSELPFGDPADFLTDNIYYGWLLSATAVPRNVRASEGIGKALAISHTTHSSGNLNATTYYLFDLGQAMSLLFLHDSSIATVR